MVKSEHTLGDAYVIIWNGSTNCNCNYEQPTPLMREDVIGEIQTKMLLIKINSSKCSTTKDQVRLTTENFGLDSMHGNDRGRDDC